MNRSISEDKQKRDSIFYAKRRSTSLPRPSVYYPDLAYPDFAAIIVRDVASRIRQSAWTSAHESSDKNNEQDLKIQSFPDIASIIVGDVIGRVTPGEHRKVINPESSLLGKEGGKFNVKRKPDASKKTIASPVRSDIIRKSAPLENAVKSATLPANLKSLYEGKEFYNSLTKTDPKLSSENISGSKIVRPESYFPEAYVRTSDPPKYSSSGGLSTNSEASSYSLNQPNYISASKLNSSYEDQSKYQETPKVSTDFLTYPTSDSNNQTLIHPKFNSASGINSCASSVSSYNSPDIQNSFNIPKYSSAIGLSGHQHPSTSSNSLGSPKYSSTIGIEMYKPAPDRYSTNSFDMSSKCSSDALTSHPPVSNKYGKPYVPMDSTYNSIPLIDSYTCKNKERLASTSSNDSFRKSYVSSDSLADSKVSSELHVTFSSPEYSVSPQKSKNVKHLSYVSSKPPPVPKPPSQSPVFYPKITTLPKPITATISNISSKKKEKRPRSSSTSRLEEYRQRAAAAIDSAVNKVTSTFASLKNRKSRKNKAYADVSIKESKKRSTSCQTLTRDCDTQTEDFIDLAYDKKIDKLLKQSDSSKKLPKKANREDPYIRTADTIIKIDSPPLETCSQDNLVPPISIVRVSAVSENAPFQRGSSCPSFAAAFRNNITRHTRFDDNSSNYSLRKSPQKVVVRAGVIPLVVENVKHERSKSPIDFTDFDSLNDSDISKQSSIEKTNMHSPSASPRAYVKDIGQTVKTDVAKKIEDTLIKESALSSYGGTEIRRSRKQQFDFSQDYVSNISSNNFIEERVKQFERAMDLELRNEKRQEARREFFLLNDQNTSSYINLVDNRIKQFEKSLHIRSEKQNEMWKNYSFSDIDYFTKNKSPSLLSSSNVGADFLTKSKFSNSSQVNDTDFSNFQDYDSTEIALNKLEEAQDLIAMIVGDVTNRVTRSVPENDNLSDETETFKTISHPDIAAVIVDNVIGRLTPEEHRKAAYTQKQPYIDEQNLVQSNESYKSFLSYENNQENNFPHIRAAVVECAGSGVAIGFPGEKYQFKESSDISSLIINDVSNRLTQRTRSSDFYSKNEPFIAAESLPEKSKYLPTNQTKIDIEQSKDIIENKDNYDHIGSAIIETAGPGVAVILASEGEMKEMVDNAIDIASVIVQDVVSRVSSDESDASVNPEMKKSNEINLPQETNFRNESYPFIGPAIVDSSVIGLGLLSMGIEEEMQEPIQEAPLIASVIVSDVARRIITDINTMSSDVLNNNDASFLIDNSEYLFDSKSTVNDKVILSTSETSELPSSDLSSADFHDDLAQSLPLTSIVSLQFTDFSSKIELISPLTIYEPIQTPQTKLAIADIKSENTLISDNEFSNKNQQSTAEMFHTLLTSTPNINITSDNSLEMTPLIKLSPSLDDVNSCFSLDDRFYSLSEASLLSDYETVSESHSFEDGMESTENGIDTSSGYTSIMDISSESMSKSEKKDYKKSFPNDSFRDCRENFDDKLSPHIINKPCEEIITLTPDEINSEQKLNDNLKLFEESLNEKVVNTESIAINSDDLGETSEISLMDDESQVLSSTNINVNKESTTKISDLDNLENFPSISKNILMLNNNKVEGILSFENQESTNETLNLDNPDVLPVISKNILETDNNILESILNFEEVNIENNKMMAINKDSTNTNLKENVSSTENVDMTFFPSDSTADISPISTSKNNTVINLEHVSLVDIFADDLVSDIKNDVLKQIKESSVFSDEIEKRDDPIMNYSNSLAENIISDVYSTLFQMKIENVTKDVQSSLDFFSSQDLEKSNLEQKLIEELDATFICMGIDSIEKKSSELFSDENSKHLFLSSDTSNVENLEKIAENLSPEILPFYESDRHKCEKIQNELHAISLDDFSKGGDNLVASEQIDVLFKDVNNTLDNTSDLADKELICDESLTNVITSSEEAIELDSANKLDHSLSPIKVVSIALSTDKATTVVSPSEATNRLNAKVVTVNSSPSQENINISSSSYELSEHSDFYKDSTCDDDLSEKLNSDKFLYEAKNGLSSCTSSNLTSQLDSITTDDNSSDFGLIVDRSVKSNIIAFNCFSMASSIIDNILDKITEISTNVETLIDVNVAKFSDYCIIVDDIIKRITIEGKFLVEQNESETNISRLTFPDIAAIIVHSVNEHAMLSSLMSDSTKPLEYDYADLASAVARGVINKAEAYKLKGTAFKVSTRKLLNEIENCNSTQLAVESSYAGSSAAVISDTVEKISAALVCILCQDIFKTIGNVEELNNINDEMQIREKNTDFIESFVNRVVSRVRIDKNILDENSVIDVIYPDIGAAMIWEIVNRIKICNEVTCSFEIDNQIKTVTISYPFLAATIIKYLINKIENSSKNINKTQALTIDDYPDIASLIAADTSLTKSGITTGDSFVYLPMYVAAEKNRLFWINELIESMGDVNEQDESGNTALHIASSKGYVDIVKALLNSAKVPCDVNIKNYEGNTALHYACLKGYCEIASVLIKSGSDVNIKNVEQGLIPLHRACYYDVKLVQLLIENGSEINVREYSQHYSPLLIACMLNNYAVAELLICSGCEVTVKDISGKSPLHHVFCSSLNRPSVPLVKLLIEAGCEVDATDDDDKTPLFYACECESSEAMAVLLDHGANASFMRPDGSLPLKFAVESHNAELVELLLKYGASPNISSLHEVEYPPIVYAAYYNASEVIKVLLQYNCEVDRTDENANTALHRACGNNSVKIVQDLLKHGADIDKKGSSGQTALHIASRYGFDEVVQVILKNGCNVNECNDYGWGAIHWAVHKGYVNIVKLLIKSGSKLHSFTEESVFGVALEKELIRFRAGDERPFIMNLEVLLLLLSAGYNICHDKVFQPIESYLVDLESEVIEDNEDFFELLMILSSQPQPLMQLCGHVIRDIFGQDLQDKVSKLDIPESLKKFLLFENLFTSWAEFYEVRADGVAMISKIV